MSKGQTIILIGDSQRTFAKELIDKAPANSIVNVQAGKRTIPQNSRMWAILSAISMAKPEGRMATPEVWKCLFLQAAGHACQFEVGLDNQPFPTGFSSSRLDKEQMSNLFEVIHEYAARYNINIDEPVKKKRKE